MIKWFGRRMYQRQLDRYVTFVCASYVAHWQGDVSEELDFDEGAKLARRRMEFWARVAGVEPRI